jgi:hypothetical protein
MPASLEDLTTDQLLAHARQMQGSHELLATLMRDPAARETVQRHLKKVNPSVSIPEIDAKDAVLAELDTERKARQALEKSIMEDRVRARLEKQRADAKSKYHLTEADMAEVEKLMTDAENPIPTYDAAARVHAASKQTASPTPVALSAPTYQMPEKDVWAGGIGNRANLDRIAMNEAFAALNDIRGGKVAGLGPAVTN